MSQNCQRSFRFLLPTALLFLSFSVEAQQNKVLGSVREASQRQAKVLLEQYGKALDAIMVESKTKGALDVFLVAEAEKKRYDTERTAHGLSDVDTALVVAVESYYTAKVDLLRQYVVTLDKLVKAETQADHISNAKEAKQERDKAAFELADIESQLPNGSDGGEVTTERSRDITAVHNEDAPDDQPPSAEPPPKKTSLEGTAQFQGHHYLMVNDRKLWGDAKKSCESRGGHLVVIDDTYEKVFVESLVHDEGCDSCWIGLNCTSWDKKMPKSSLDSHRNSSYARTSATVNTDAKFVTREDSDFKWVSGRRGCGNFWTPPAATVKSSGRMDKSSTAPACFVAMQPAKADGACTWVVLDDTPLPASYYCCEWDY